VSYTVSTKSSFLPSVETGAIISNSPYYYGNYVTQSYLADPRNDAFGDKIAFSKNGNYLAVSRVGARDFWGPNGEYTGRGQISIYCLNPYSVFHISNIFTYSDFSGFNQFGYRLSISDNGDRLVSSLASVSNGVFALLYFRRTNTNTWIVVDRSIRIGASGGTEMNTTSISGDGGTCVFLAYPTGIQICSLSDIGVTTQATFTGTSNIQSTSLSYDGNICVVGDIVNAANPGRAYIYQRSGTTWSLVKTLTADTPVADDKFGKYVKISGDGSTLFISGPGISTTYIYYNNNSSWTKDNILPYYLVNFDVSYDGSILCGGGGTIGRFYITVKSSNTWSVASTIYAPANQLDTNYWSYGYNSGSFGCSCGITSDGQKLCISSPRENNPNNGNDWRPTIHVYN
jgi:hypothetical protein